MKRWTSSISSIKSICSSQTSKSLSHKHRANKKTHACGHEFFNFWFTVNREVLLGVLLDKCLQLFEMHFLIFLDSLPKSDSISVPLGVFDVIAFDTPETVVFLDVLLHQVIDMIVLHADAVTDNVISITLFK